jgi:hypothetical protein
LPHKVAYRLFFLFFFFGNRLTGLQNQFVPHLLFAAAQPPCGRGRGAKSTGFAFIFSGANSIGFAVFRQGAPTHKKKPLGKSQPKKLKSARLYKPKKLRAEKALVFWALTYINFLAICCLRFVFWLRVFFDTILK